MLNKVCNIIFPFCLIVLCLILSGSIYANDRQVTDPENTIIEYIESIKISDWEKAKSLWLPEIIEKSRQKQIVYENVFAKYDCTSPVLRLLKDIQSEKLKVQVHGGEINDDVCTVPISLTDGRTTIDHEYMLIRDKNNWKITSPLFYNTRNWYTIETEYCRIIFNDSSRINENAIGKLDNFIGEIIKRLNIPDERASVLNKSKIDYFLCGENDIEELTGYQIHGVADLRFDAIITRHLPHKHELVHLLYNITLGELPLYTLPLFQEGVAVALGGRWQKSPEVIMQLGNALLNSGFISLDSMLTKYDFEVTAGTPDVTYPISGLLVDALINEYGLDALESIYRDLSGTIETICSLSADSIKASLARHSGKSWTELDNLITKNGRGYASSGLDVGVSMPEYKPICEIMNLESSCKIWENDSCYIFEINCSNLSCCGSVFFREKKPSISDRYSSVMFHENPNHPAYSQEMYGFDFDNNEIGLYNYYTDCLLAKYIAGFYDSSIQSLSRNNIFLFSISKSLFEYNLERFEIELYTI